MTSGWAVVVGDVINDVVVRPLGPIASGTDTPSAVQQTPGGSGANQAAWMASLGARVRFAGRAGAADCDRHRLALRQAGVEARITPDRHSSTGTIVVIVDSDGDRSMFTDRGASARLGPSDLSLDLLEGASLLHVSGYALFGDGGRTGVAALWSAAQVSGLTTTVDPGSLAGLRTIGANAFFAATAGAAVVFPNLAEGRYLAGADDPAAIVDALLARYPVVALKLGPDGVLVASRQGDRIERRGRPDGVVDSTGAGDAFCAGCLTATLAGADLGTAVDLGIEAASLAVAHVGGRPPRSR